jgi:hypothetical protein
LTKGINSVVPSVEYTLALSQLAVSYDFRTAEFLAACAGVDQSYVRIVINTLREFLLSEGEVGFRIYHSSFADFLTDRRRNDLLPIDSIVANRRTAQYYLGQSLRLAEGFTEARLDGYGIAHLVDHLIGSQEWQVADSLVSGTPAWMEVVIAKTGSSSSYIKDIDNIIDNQHDTKDVLFTARLYLCRVIARLRANAWSPWAIVAKWLLNEQPGR